MITLDLIELPDDLEWVDRYDFYPATHQYKRSLTGHLFTEIYDKFSGRLITLSGDSDRAWITKGTLESLVSKLQGANNDTPMLLTLNDGTTYNVLFKLDGIALEATPVGWYVSNPDENSQYFIKLRLISI